MKDTERKAGQDGAARSRPAWVDEQDTVEQGARPRRERRLPRDRRPVPGKQEDDGLWVHVTETGIGVVLAVLGLVVFIPHSVPLWMIATAAFAIAAAAWWVSLSLTGSMSVSLYLAGWGVYLSGWLTAARHLGPWHAGVIFFLLLPAAVLVITGVPVIRRHRDRVNRVAEIGRDNANIRECRHWDDLLQRFGVTGTAIRDVIKVDGGYQVHCRLGKYNEGGRKPTGIEGIRELTGTITQHKRLPKGSVYIEEEPANGNAADFIIHVRSVTGPRLTRYLPAENSLLSINDKFSLGVMDTGRPFRLRLREVRVFICGVIGSGKSTLLNIFIAQLCRMPDALICMIDLKGGQEARAWLMPWVTGLTGRPAIDWLATTREEADVMLDALKRAGIARSESGLYRRKLRPSPDAPAFIVICDETTVMTGHFLREDGLSNTKLAVKLLQLSETFRSVGIDPVVSSVRAVVDNTGNSGIKAMSDVRIGMKVSTVDEGRMIFPDNLPAARQLAQLKDRGMGIPKVGAELFPPVHFYNITDGEPDDDGNPTEDRITPIVLSTADRCPQPEQFVQDAMNEVRVTVMEGGRERDMGVYEARWEQPHIKELIAKWREGASVPAPGPKPVRTAAGNDDDDEFDDIVQHSLSDIDPALDDDDETGGRLHPAHKRMRQLLIARRETGRTAGYKSGMLQSVLASEGLSVRRETVCRWLAADEKKGYVIRASGKWIWRLGVGEEFDIPGMD